MGTQEPVLLGLTGVYCAGKNYVASLLEELGCGVLDVDKLGHRAIELEKEAILGLFGRSILGENGSIDRKKLGERVFGEKEELAALEALVHPRANRLTEEWIAASNRRVLVINAALLHRSSVFPRLSCIIFVRAPLLTRLLRARRRDKLPFSTLLRRFKSQKEFIPQYFSQNADIHTVNNRGYFRFCATRRRETLKRRLGAILSREGIEI